MTNLPAIDSPEVAATQPHAMVGEDGSVFYPDSPEDVALIAEWHGAVPLHGQAALDAFLRGEA